MPEGLKDIIIRHISTYGAMSVGEYMSLCLSHPVHGYYMKKDPFGRGGDFITAPEVSQMFGEMVGAWLADMWMQAGSPSPFVLLECGPGRGTLMRDIMRATKNVPGFHAAAEMHLLEISPVLKGLQAAALKDFEPRWHESLDTLPSALPIFTVANEFLDALPFTSLQKVKSQWEERVIIHKQDKGLCYDLRPARAEVVERVPFHLRGALPGSVFECSPERCDFISALGERIGEQGGAALVIDYGHIKSAIGDTFQALKRNSYCDVFDDPGDADLTSHVDFESIISAVPSELKVTNAVSQGAFLKALGIDARADMLKRSGGDKAAQGIEKGLQRLCASDQMGALFKVFCMYKDGGENGHAGITPHGF